MTKNWKLKETAQLSSENKTPSSVQLYHFAGGENKDSENTIWFVGLTGVGSRADSFVTQLLLKAFQKKVFVQKSDIFVTPIIYSDFSEKANKQFSSTPELWSDFSNKVKTEEAAKELPHFQSIMTRWAIENKPKCLVTFSLGTPKIEYVNTPDTIVEKLKEFCERPCYDLTASEEGSKDHKVEKNSFVDFCLSNDMNWINITLDSQMKTFDEVCKSEWKHFVGPAIKWLSEGQPYRPEEKQVAEEIEIIPPLEMPMEFANI